MLHILVGQNLRQTEIAEKYLFQEFIWPREYRLKSNVHLILISANSVPLKGISKQKKN
jgi:hypothetical protein